MKSIREKVQTDYPKSDILEEEMTRICYRVGFKKGANYVLDIVEKELQHRMLEDYNQGAKEDEIAQGCMASMIMFVRQLKK